MRESTTVSRHLSSQDPSLSIGVFYRVRQLDRRGRRVRSERFCLESVVPVLDRKWTLTMSFEKLTLAHLTSSRIFVPGRNLCSSAIARTLRRIRPFPQTADLSPPRLWEDVMRLVCELNLIRYVHTQLSNLLNKLMEIAASVEQFVTIVMRQNYGLRSSEPMIESVSREPGDLPGTRACRR
jgi:hypothetical protein